MSSFRDDLEYILCLFEDLDVSDYTLVKERLILIDKEFLSNLKCASHIVSSRGKKSAINRYNKDEKI